MKRFFCLLLCFVLLVLPVFSEDDEFYTWEEYFYEQTEGLSEDAINYAIDAYWTDDYGYSPRDKWLIMMGMAFGYQRALEDHALDYDHGFEEGYDYGYDEGYYQCYVDHDLEY